MAKKESSKMFKWILLLLLAVLLIVGAVVGTLYAMNNTSLGQVFAGNGQDGSAGAPTAPSEPPAAPIFLELEPFTVTLKGELRNSILYTGITLRVADEASRAQLQSYMPEVRDRVLRLLYTQDAERVQTPEGRTALAENLLQALRQPYAPQPVPPNISNVLFTSFVVQ